MSRGSRAALGLVGVAVFAAGWQLVVEVTRPAPVRRVTLAIGAEGASPVRAAVVDATSKLALDTPLGSPEAKARLGVALGALRPTLAVTPRGCAPCVELVAELRRTTGLGLEPVIVDPGEAEAMARDTQRARLLRPSWLPTPGEALLALGGLARSGELVRHVVASLFRVLSGFALAVALGVPTGLLLGTVSRAFAFANPVLQMLRPISPIAWLPVATLALGGGDVAAVFLLFLAAFFPISMATAAAAASVDRKYLRSAENFGVRGVDRALSVVLPASLPSILTSLRVALGISWVVVVAAEMLGVESGLGYLVLDARNQLRFDRVVAAMIVIGSIGLGLDTAFRSFESAELARRGGRSA